MLEIFDRWISGRKINLLRDQIAHTHDEDAKRVLEEALAVEQRTLESGKDKRAPEK